MKEIVRDVLIWLIMVSVTGFVSASWTTNATVSAIKAEMAFIKNILLQHDDKIQYLMEQDLVEKKGEKTCPIF